MIEQAAQFCDKLCNAIDTIGGLHTEATRAVHIPGAFDPDWLGSLPLPLLSAGEATLATHSVTLVGGDTFQRLEDAGDLRRAYECRPRTRAYVDIGRDGDWVDLTKRHLTNLIGREVVCSLYQSRFGDAVMGRHCDQWLGLIVQWQGNSQGKVWCLWEGPDQNEFREIQTLPGDILILPHRVLHAVSTPVSSLHMVVAIRSAIHADYAGLLATN